MSNDNESSDLLDIERKKLNALLTNLEILENHIFMNSRISYDTALGSIASIVLISTFAYINIQIPLLSAIPFIIFVEGMLYLHLMELNMKYDAYGMKIENKINKILKSNVIRQIHDLGAYSKEVKSSHYMKLVIPFALIYFFSAFFGGKSLVANNGKIVLFFLLTAYVLMATALILTGTNLYQKYKDFHSKNK